MREGKSSVYKEWLEKAEEDYRFVKTYLPDEKEFFAQLCFHLHQAAEKYLKAFIIYKNLPFRKVHNLKELIAICKSAEPEFEKVEDEALYLNKFYIDTRYPVHWPANYTKEEAVKALNSVEKIRNLVLQKIL